MQKVYWDNVNNKEVVDVTGTKVEADVIAEYGLDAGTQVMELDDGDTTSVVAGTLTKTTKAQNDTAAENAATAKETSRAGKETSTKSVRGLTDAQFADLKESLGL
jgi:hypothetical protein